MLQHDIILSRLLFVLENHGQEAIVTLILTQKNRRYLIWVSFKYVTSRVFDQ